jgi:hypothetical protein
LICTLCSFLFILGFCWFSELNMVVSFKILMSSATPVRKCFLSWAPVFVIAFLPPLYAILLWASSAVLL